MARPSPRAIALRLKERARPLWELVRERVLRVVMRPWQIFQRICFGIGLGVLVLSFFSLLYISWFLGSLPNIQSMTFEQLQERGRKKVYAQMENKKARYGWTALRSVSRELLYSIVVSEDATFFEHEGLNIEMILTSLAENLREGKHVYGASTISQQVVKNLFLTNERTYTRKLKEFILTKRLERKLSKNDILELYLNIAEFGPDIYGVEAAAHHYFGKTPTKLNAAEGVFLGLMLPSPKRNYFSIYQNQNLTKQKLRRVERVLRDMLYEEYLSEAQYRKYVKYRYFGRSASRSPAAGQ